MRANGNDFDLYTPDYPKSKNTKHAPPPAAGLSENGLQSGPHRPVGQRGGAGHRRAQSRAGAAHRRCGHKSAARRYVQPNYSRNRQSHERTELKDRKSVV